MSQQNTKELLDKNDEEELIREQAIIEWSLKYLEKRNGTGEPPLKKIRLDEQELLEWSMNYLRERKERKT